MHFSSVMAHYFSSVQRSNILVCSVHKLSLQHGLIYIKFFRSFGVVAVIVDIFSRYMTSFVSFETRYVALNVKQTFEIRQTLEFAPFYNPLVKALPGN